MNRFLLINNKKFFDNHNIVTINNVKLIIYYIIFNDVDTFFIKTTMMV